ncbi:aldo/keto reductase [Streptomyces anulatus]|uniref:aldo/keto reductase n=1 Tax=Streptomyces anulatus TaxID=1892 RepID=UPI00344871FC
MRSTSWPPATRPASPSSAICDRRPTASGRNPRNPRPPGRPRPVTRSPGGGTRRWAGPSPFDRSGADVLSAGETAGIAFVPYFPLATGMLRPGLDTSQAPPAEQLGALDEITGRYGTTRAQVALAWLLGRSPVTLAVPGTSPPRPPERERRGGPPEPDRRRHRHPGQNRLTRRPLSAPVTGATSSAGRPSGVGAFMQRGEADLAAA